MPAALGAVTFDEDLPTSTSRTSWVRHRRQPGTVAPTNMVWIIDKRKPRGMAARPLTPRSNCSELSGHRRCGLPQPVEPLRGYLILDARSVPGQGSVEVVGGFALSAAVHSGFV